jgi:hypothetical protein
MPPRIAHITLDRANVDAVTTSGRPPSAVRSSPARARSTAMSPPKTSRTGWTTLHGVEGNEVSVF